MRRIALVGCTLLLAACAGGADKKAADSVATADSAAAVPAPPPPLSLADLAGTWQMRSVPVSGDTSPTVYEMKITSADTGWTLTFPKGKALPVRVLSVAGDSVSTEVGPFASQRRKGVQVVTNQVLRLVDGRLVGDVVAHYRVKTADSVVAMRSEGSRKQ